jgi:polysaccharide biosynthesis protein PslE
MREESRQQYPAPWAGPSGLAFVRGGFGPELDADEGLNLRHLFTVIFKHKLKIALAFLSSAVLCAVGLFIFLYYHHRPIFEAKALVMVKFGWETYNPDLSANGKLFSMVNPAEMLSSEVRILESREIKERLVSTLKAEAIFPGISENSDKSFIPAQAALLRIERGLSVKPAPKGNLIEVSFQDSSPARASTIVNQLVSLYIERRAEVYKDPKSILFLDKKTEEYHQKLNEAEEKLKAFRDEFKIISFDEQRSQLLTQRMNILAQLSSVSNDIKEMEQKIVEFEKQLHTLPKNSLSTQGGERASDGQSRLLALQLQERELLSKYKEDTRMVINVREQIQMVKDYLAKQSGPGAPPNDPIYQDVQKQIIQAKAQVSASRVKGSSLEQDLVKITGELGVFEARENTNRELVREVSSLEEKYKSYRQRQEEARIFDELERQKMTSVTLIEAASPPIAPINSPKPMPFYVGAILAVGLFAAIGLAFLIELISHGMLTPADAERRLNLPVLATVPFK